MHFSRHGSALVVTLLLAATATLRAQRDASRIDVIHYDAQVRLDFERKEIEGMETITAIATEDASAVTLDAAGIRVDALRANGLPARISTAGDKLTITLTTPVVRGDTIRIAASYKGRQGPGLAFRIDQVHTAFHTERWLISNADPADRATISLDLILPDTLAVAATGRSIGSEPVAPGRARHRFALSIPHPSYLFGFAAGRFNDTTIASEGRSYRFTGPLAADTLALALASTPEIFRYFTRRAGIALPDSLYTQVLLNADVEQEAAGMALLRASYVDELLADPREDWLVAHEGAHQWWGNMVTCASWSEIWLNEGMATFMTACWKEERWGRDEYDREMVMARIRWERLRDAGRDRPLIYTRWSTAAEANSGVAYYKGAAVLHYLRFLLGEEVFWRGIARYTREHFGGSATTADLQHAMEHESGKRLDRFFALWAATQGAPRLTAKHRVRGSELEVEIRRDGEMTDALPMMIAVETTSGRRAYRIDADEEITSVRLPLAGELLSVRIDDGGNLPVEVRHARPWSMLRHQMAHEPDVAGRVGAIMEAERLRATDAGITAELVAALEDAVRHDSSRLVQRVAEQVLKRAREEK